MRAPAPALSLEGKRAAAPVTLLRHQGRVYLRYDLSCKARKDERRVSYAIDGVDETWQFTVPAKGAAPRMAYVSCNGFSDPGGMRKLIKAENAVWADLLCNHDRQLRPADYALDREQLWHEAQIHDQGGQRFHLMLMGGDQIYFDSIWEDIKPLKRWIGLTRDEQLRYPVDAALEREIEDYYLRLYADRWLRRTARPGWRGDAAGRRPGHGAHAHGDDVGRPRYLRRLGLLQSGDAAQPLFQRLFHHARRAFWCSRCSTPSSCCRR